MRYKEWIEKADGDIGVRRALIAAEHGSHIYAALVTYCADSAVGHAGNYSGRFIEVVGNRIELRYKSLGCDGDYSKLIREIELNEEMKKKIIQALYSIETKEDFEKLWEELLSLNIS